MIFIVEAFFSGCISKVINDGKDYSWAKIKRAINDKYDRNLSTKIYHIIERTLNIVTNHNFKDTDKLYEAIEKMFFKFRDNGSTIESVKCGLRLLSSDVSVERCENFLEKFYEGICQDNELYKVIGLILQEKGIQINQEGFKQLDEKMDNLTAIINNINENKIDLQNREPVKSRTQEYADKWNANMFLNDFDEWDETAGVNVKLSDVYINTHLPHFVWGHNKKESDYLDFFLYKCIMETDESTMLLVLGQPGIGKSTLITWITINFVDRINDILVYKFASDLGNINWENRRISNKILEELGLNYSDLNGKILILDGFDEVSIEANKRRDILDSLYIDWVNNENIGNFLLIITCRENYIPRFAILKCKYITLQPWDEIQIKSFCKIFQRKTRNKISENTVEKLFENKEILGIPLILYMVLALNISIEKEGSIVDVYDKIFALEGGIYDRCINNKNFAEPHRIGEVKKYIHQVSREIAIWMFENEPEEAYIPKNEYQKICDFILSEEEQENKDIQQDFLIGNYFKLVKHCEGLETEKLFFVHRSIYEYFVTETIIISVRKGLTTSKEMLACVFGKLLKKGRLSENILNYLKHKIVTSSLYDFYNIIDETFQSMINNGMTYYLNERYKNIIKYEIKIFDNMLEILHLWNHNKWKFSPSITDYLKFCEGCSLNLIRVDLSEVDLSEVNLSKSNLEG